MQQERSKSDKHNLVSSVMPQQASTSATEQTVPLLMPQPTSTSAIEQTIPLLMPQPTSTSAIEQTIPLLMPQQASTSAIEQTIPLLMPQPISTLAIEQTIPLLMPQQASTSAIDQTIPLLMPQPTSTSTIQHIDYHQPPGYNKEVTDLLSSAHLLPTMRYLHDFYVICPLRYYPEQPCPWRGKQRHRAKHIKEIHKKEVMIKNYVRLEPNYWEIIDCFREYFLCYAITKSNPNKLYCVAKHICLATPCALTYQYRCEIRSKNKLEIICDTRLVTHITDNLNSLELSGNSARFDEDTIKHIFDIGHIRVHLYIFLPNPI